MRLTLNKINKTKVIKTIYLTFTFLCSFFSIHAQTVKIYNTNGSIDESKWTLVTGTPTNINPVNTVIENGLIRVSYNCSRGLPGQTSTYYDQKAGHVIFLKTGSTYTIAQDKEFGDWTYVGGGFTDDPTAFKVLHNTGDLVEIILEFQNHRMTAGDNSLNPVKKRVILKKGEYGYTAKLEVFTHAAGEREVGFGNSKSANIVSSDHFFNYTTNRGYLWNPNDPVPAGCCHYEFIREENQANYKDWWGAGLAFNNTFYRLVALRSQTSGASPAIRTASFKKGYIAGLIRYNAEATTAFTGYEAYIAVVPYNGVDAKNIVVTGNSALIKVPKAGKYTIYSETSTDNGGSKKYSRIIDELDLMAGDNLVDVTGKNLLHAVVAPLTNGVDFPEDIFNKYLGIIPKKTISYTADTTANILIPERTWYYPHDPIFNIDTFITHMVLSKFL